MPPTLPNATPDVSLLRALAACHQLFKLLASEVRSRPGVSRVNHEFDLSQTAEGCRFTEYVSPERIDGRWAFWQFEIIISADVSAVVNAESLSVDADGNPLREIIATVRAAIIKGD